MTARVSICFVFTVFAGVFLASFLHAQDRQQPRTDLRIDPDLQRQQIASPKFHVMVAATGVARGEQAYLVQTPSGQKIELKTADVLTVKKATATAGQKQPPHAVVVLASAVQPGRQRGSQNVTTLSGQQLTLSAPDVLGVEEQKPAAQAQQPTEQQKETAQRDPRFVKPARELKLTTRALPVAISKLPANVQIQQGGEPRTVKVEGNGLDQLTRVEILQGGKAVSGVKVELGALQKDGTRSVSIVPTPQLRAGQYDVRFLTRSGAAQQVLRIDVKPSDLLMTVAPKELMAGRRLDPTIRIKPGSIGATKDPATMYDVWRDSGTNRWSETVRVARQIFIANGTHLETAELLLGGSGEVRVMVYEAKSSPPLLASQTTSIKTNQPTTVTFENPVGLTPGGLYYLHVERTSPSGTFTVFGSKVPADYIWTHAQIQRQGEEMSFAPHPGLNMKLRGYWENMPANVKNPTRPNKKALLILLENGGISLDDLGDLQNALPDITIASCGNFTLELAPGETIFSKLGSAIYNVLHCVNPDNWTFKKMTFAEWWAPVSDYSMELVNNSVSDAIAGNTNKKYDKVVRLHQGDFNRERVLQELQSLSSQYVVDIHLLCHGTTDAFVGDNHEFFMMHNFFRPLKQKMVTGEVPLHVRGVYQMNCSSGTLIDEWQSLGASVVNGTSGDKLNCMPTQYHHFLTHWLSGKKFSESINNSFNEAKPYWSVVWLLTPNKVNDSKHSTHGNGNMTMDSP